MTPFGRKVRALRAAHNVTLKQMASDLQISSAYLSALEHGKKGLPSPALVVQVCEYFHLIWDDFEEVQRLVTLSHPRVVVDTAGLGADHTELANRLAQDIAGLTPAQARKLIERLAGTQSGRARRTVAGRRGKGRVARG